MVFAGYTKKIVMTSKPLTPKMHGLIDYVFSAIQVILPGSIAINSSTMRTYQMLGLGFLLTNAFTDTPVGLKKSLSFRTHQKADLAFLGTLGLLSFTGMIRNDKKALAFHLGFLTLAATHYLLTDYSSSPGANQVVPGKVARGLKGGGVRKNFTHDDSYVV